MPPTSAPPLPPTAAPRRGRAGWLALAAGATVVLLVGGFVVVRLAGSGGGAPSTVAASAAGQPGDGTTSATGLTAGEQAAAGTSQNPSTAAGTGTGAPNPTRGATAAAGPTSDDFTASALNLTMWGVYGTKAPSSSYSAGMVRVSGGELQVLGVGKNPTAAANLSGGLCWCGVNGNHTYGKWQVRARFDAGSGYRQILGLWPQSGSPATDGSVTFAGAGDGAKKSLGVTLVPPSGGTAARASLTGDFTAWHVYTVDWRPTYVKMYVDSTLVYDSSADASHPAVPKKPQHLIIQQDKGPGNGIPAADSTTPAQVIMHVDWVRFYS
jgi:hypothetical protein